MEEHSGTMGSDRSPLFADNPTLLEPLLPDSPTDNTSLPTLESVSKPSNPTRQTSSPSPSTTPNPLPPVTDSPTPSPLSDPSATESEAASEGAFNEETGEINWDCPCLGGMAHGPCGDQFRTAFSCFVYSKEEPKGMDCIEHFKGMQDCFREHPDIYGGELEEDEVEKEALAQEGGGSKEGLERPMQQDQDDSSVAATSAANATPTEGSKERPQVRDREQEDQSEETKMKRAKEATAQVKRDHSPLSESDELVPKAAHDATTANSGK
ncbi:MAG: hypothetical protein Q9166_005165 [cf. Caloplaca sp. 2 TL-2023]